MSHIPLTPICGSTCPKQTFQLGHQQFLQPIVFVFVNQINTTVGLPTSYRRPPTSYSLLPSSYLLLPTAHMSVGMQLESHSYFLLPTSYFLLPSSYLLLPPAHLKVGRQLKSDVYVLVQVELHPRGKRCLVPTS